MTIFLQSECMPCSYQIFNNFKPRKQHLPSKGPQPLQYFNKCGVCQKSVIIRSMMIFRFSLCQTSITSNFLIRCLVVIGRFFNILIGTSGRKCSQSSVGSFRMTFVTLFWHKRSVFQSVGIRVYDWEQHQWPL